VYEPITLQIDRAHGEGAYRSYSLYFVGRLINIVEAGQSTMRLYEWADRGRLLYLVLLEEDQVSLPDAPSTRSSTPTPVVAPPQGEIAGGGARGNK
jgi:hypothetical protein